jgi:hypothetical protein
MDFVQFAVRSCWGAGRWWSTWTWASGSCGQTAVQVAVQQQVAGTDNADEADDDDPRLLCRGRRRGRR